MEISNCVRRCRPIFTGWLAAGLFLFAAATAPAAVINAGNITGMTITTNAGNGIWTASFALSGGGSAEITPYAPDLVRVNYHWAGPFATEQVMIDKPLNDWAGHAATIVDQGTRYLIQTAQLDIEVEKTPFKVHFKSKSGYFLSQDDFTERDADYNYTGQRGTSSSKLKNRRLFPSGQAIFGLGEYGGPMNRRNREIDIWNTATYNWGEFTNPTYLHVPFFYGVQPATGGNPAFTYGIFLNNPCRPLFKFGTESGDRLSYQAGDGRMDYFFFGGGAAHAFARVMDRFAELTGRPTFLPKWGLGHHLSRFSYDNQDWVQYIADEAGNQDIPLDAVYMDIDYMDADGDGDISDGQLRQLTTNFKFPDPAGLINFCEARGVKVVPLIEPWLIPGDPLHTEANNALHFIKDNGGNTVTRGIYVGNVSFFDFSSTPMRQWWQGKILNWMNSFNFHGIWNDLTEPEGGDLIPHNALLWIDGQYGDNNDSRRFWSNERNFFGNRCARQSYETMMAKNPNKRPFVLSRSGTAGLQKYAVSWSGDTRADWFYHRATIRFGAGAMIAGAAWFGNDVGGFAGSASEELMVRSTEANALTPFFRNHCDKSAANREPWRFNDPYKSMQRDLIKFRYRLMPYFYTLAYESTINGRPLNVPPVFDYYNDANTYTEISDYDYLVGEFLLAAPVYAQGANSRQAYLPYRDGIHWYNYHSNERHNGGQTINVSAPLGTLPLFVRSGAIIPMGPSMQYANEFQSPWMDINCWPDGQSEFTLFEDDGETWNYQGNGYSKRRMVSHRTAAYWDFTIEAKQGTYDTGSRAFYVYGYNIGTNVVTGVRVNGAAIPQVTNFDDAPQGWRMAAAGRVGIKVPDNGAHTAIRVNFADVEDSIHLVAPTYSIAENAGSVRVVASRVGAATSTVSAAFSTANGTATAGVGYAATSGSLVWNAGDTNNKFVDIVILDNQVYEGNKTFTFNLSSAIGAILGAPSTATITILENDPVPPALVITNPAGSITVAAAVSNLTVQGMANAYEWSGLRWSNNLTGASGPASTAFYWNIPGVALGVGTNLITVTATNTGGPVAMDSGSDPIYADGWATNDNGGFGWGAWEIFTSSTNGNLNGRFMADSDAVNIGKPSWGLYANSGNLSEAKRMMTNALAVGQTVHVSLDHGFLDAGAGAGVALQNIGGETLWEFYFNGGQTNYVMNNNSITTEVTWTSGGIDVSVTLATPSSFVARITPAGGTTKTNAGNLQTSGDQTIRLFRAWNFNAGTGSERDFFFNNLSISSPGGAVTSATVQVIRPASGGDSQIPQEWRDRYNLVGPNSGDFDDIDNDGRSNYEEYLSDTNPTNAASFFNKIDMLAQAPGPNGELTVIIPAPTTNSRVYDLSYSTNLLQDLWWPLGFNQPGADNGGSLSLMITNSPDDVRHYRGRVFLP